MARPFPLILGLLLATAGASLKAESPLQRVIYLPYVMHGTIGGVYTETTVVISNPGPAAADLLIGSVPSTDPSWIVLRAGETVSLKHSGEPFESAAIQIVSNNPFAATAHIQTRPSEGSPILLGEMAVLGQEPVSKCTIPVFVDHPIAQNTGIVFRPYYGAHFLLSLYSAGGELVASRRLERSMYGPPPPVRLFITELFPELPASFHSGCLIIEDTWPTAQSFVPMAVYTRGYSMRAGTVSAEDIPVEWAVMLTSRGNVSQQASDLAERYHFSVREIPTVADDFFLALMPSGTARVAAQDQKIRTIFPNGFAYLSGARSPEYLKGER